MFSEGRIGPDEMFDQSFFWTHSCMNSAVEIYFYALTGEMERKKRVRVSSKFVKSSKNNKRCKKVVGCSQGILRRGEVYPWLFSRVSIGMTKN